MINTLLLFFCTLTLTSLMDWLPSGLILNDPVWIIFFGSIWEMAQSISSTRALQAENGEVEEETLRPGHRWMNPNSTTSRHQRLTSTSHVLSRSGCLTQTQEGTQKNERQQKQGRVPHFTPTHRDVCIIYYGTDTSAGVKQRFSQSLAALPLSSFHKHSLLRLLCQHWENWVHLFIKLTWDCRWF